MPNTTSRLTLQEPLTSDSSTELRTAITANASTLDSAVLVTEGTISARPSASSVEKDHIYKATDTGLWYISDGTNWNVIPIGLRGATNISTTGSRTNTAFGFLNDANDQVSGIVLPANGLIAVWYQALWQNSVTSAGQAAIFLGSNQLVIQGWDASTGHEPLPQSAAGIPASLNEPLFSFFGGLGTAQSGTAYSADVTTGQVVGLANVDGGTVGIQIGASPTSFGNPSTGTGSESGIVGGPCYIFAAAGTYTVSVQFKASSGSVSASNRKLWVEAVPFG